MPKPAGNIPTWNTGGANQTEPNGAKKALGWTVNEAPPSSYFNWLQNKYGEWLSYLNGLEAENLVFTGLVRLARLAGSSDTVPGLDTTDAPTGTYRLLWRIKLDGNICARLYSMRNAAVVDNFDGGDGLALVINAAFDGANWSPDDAAADTWRLNLCASDGLSLYHRTAAAGTFSDAVFLGAANYVFEIGRGNRDFDCITGGANPGVNATGAGTRPAVKGWAGAGAGAIGVEGVGDDLGSAVKGTAGYGASAIGVEGVAGIGASAIGVQGTAGTGVSGLGVKGSAGNANNAAGVQGVASATGPSAVLGTKTTGNGASEAALYGDSSASSGYAVIANGDTTAPVRSGLRLVPQEAPSTGQVGDLYVNSGDAKLYLCTAAGSPGTWVVVGSQA